MFQGSCCPLPCSTSPAASWGSAWASHWGAATSSHGDQTHGVRRDEMCWDTGHHELPSPPLLPSRPMNQHPPGLHRRQQGLDVTAGMWMAARSPQACFVPTFLESWIPRWASIGMCRVSSDWFALNRTSEVGNLVCGGDRAQATQSSQWEAQFGDRLAGLGWRDPSRGLVLTGRLWMLLCP